jgi:hypothetical protein
LFLKAKEMKNTPDLRHLQRTEQAAKQRLDRANQAVKEAKQEAVRARQDWMVANKALTEATIRAEATKSK